MIGSPGGPSANNISNEDLQKLPLFSYRGDVAVITNVKELDQALHEISDHQVLGFDTETKPTFVKGQIHKVALVQIAAPEKVWLIRLQKTGMTPSILAFLQDYKLKKAGIGLHQDLGSLQQFTRFKPGGFLDLTVHTKKIGLEVQSLRKLAALILGVRISKNAQLSNWEAPVLSDKQIEYAATDAWVCLEMYRKLEGIR